MIPFARALLASLGALAVAAASVGACGERVSLGVEPAPDGGAGGRGGAGGGHGAGPSLPSAACVGRGCGVPCDAPCNGDAGPCRPGHCDPQGVCREGPEDRCAADALVCAKGDCGQRCSPCDPKHADCKPSSAYVCDAFGTCLFATAECPCTGPGCTGTQPWRPCGGRACGEPCHACAPGASDCTEPPGDKACTVAGACVLAIDAACPPGAGPCGKKACGEPCGPCGIGAPDCTSGLPSTCDLEGACRFQPPRCDAPCQGKAAGAACTLCPPDRPTCVEAKGSKVCDAAGRCVPAPLPR